MAENQEGQVETPQNPEVEDQSALNPDAQSASASPAGQEDFGNRLKALESQLAREQERNQQLERSLQIQERYLQTQTQTQTQPQAPQSPEDKWSSELEVLDKALDPVFQKRLKSVTEPLQQTYGTIIEDNDALRFEIFLQRNNPELLEDEESYNKTMQQIEVVRQAARQRGMNVSRVDAFVFNEGLQGTKQKVQQRKQKRTTATSSEARRQLETQAALGTSPQGEPRIVANAGIQAIRDKANRGERLSEAERTKLRDFVSNVEL